MAEIVPISTQNSQKSAFFWQFLGGFSGFWQLAEALQHFFSSLLTAFSVEKIGLRLPALDLAGNCFNFSSANAEIPSLEPMPRTMF